MKKMIHKKQWSEEGLTLSTTSNEAAKLFDATLTQYIGWYDDASLGGIENSCSKMLKADESFVMGHVLESGLELMGTGRNPQQDADFKKTLDDLQQLAQARELTEREKLHVKAIDVCGKGDMAYATALWEDIVAEYPTDMLAIKLAHDAYFYLGYQAQMRDSIARVMPVWAPTTPLYSYLLGMHAFGLCETNLYAEAERAARRSLELNRRDAWATHALAHVLEMTGRTDEGIAFMSSTLPDWEPCGMLACHNFWHWAVYHLEKGESEGAIDIFDGEIIKRTKSSGAMLDIVDACSMLWRLEMEGVNVGSRWSDLLNTTSHHRDDHVLLFNDVHVLMSCVGAGDVEAADGMLASLEQFIRTGVGSNHLVTKEIGLQLAGAFVAYKQQEFAKCADLLLPIRYDIKKIGGSNAQRDVFSQMLIHACLQSNEKRHKKLARHLLAERKALKENSPLTERLMVRAMAHHAD